MGFQKKPFEIRLPDIRRSLVDKDFIVVIYEFLEEAVNEEDVVDSVYTFMRLISFCLTEIEERNWRGGSGVGKHPPVLYASRGEASPCHDIIILRGGRGPILLCSTNPNPSARLW